MKSNSGPWDNWAKKYGSSYKATTLSPNIKKIEIASMARWIKPNSSVFEVGCGNGINLLALHDLIPGLDLYGCDTSNDMLDQAVKEAGKRVVKLDLTKADIVYHKLLGPGYDYVICDRVLINIHSKENRRKALENMLGGVKHGGRLIMIENFKENYALQNLYRKQLGLNKRKWPPFNDFMDHQELNWLRNKCDPFVVEENISALHDLLVYVLLPKLYPKKNSPGKWYYEHPIVNELTKLITQGYDEINLKAECGQNVMYVWRKL